MEEKTKSPFEELSSIDVTRFTERKQGGGGRQLSYLPWASAWGILCGCYPDSSYMVYESASGLNYFTDGRTAYVKCSVTVCGRELIEYLPVMSTSLRSIPVEQMTSMDVTRSIQRCLTKAIARHGLGLYIYDGEDVPENYSVTDESDMIIGMLAGITEREDLDTLWRTYPEYHGHQRVRAAFTEKANELKNQGNERH